MTREKLPEQADVATDLDALEDVDVAPAAGSRVYLVVSVADSAPRVFDLPEDAEVTIGRTGDGVTIVVDDSRVSRKHARIVRRGADLTVRDLGSRNGTKVNAAPLRAEERRLGAGDVVKIGPAEIVVAVVGHRGHTSLKIAVDAHAPARDGEAEDPGGDGVVVADAAMRKVFQVARRLGRTQTTALILGETGVGKEVVAEEIHRSSARAAGPFVRLNCASLPETLLESELFGFEKGAFTGADRRKIGYVEAAAGGTLLLDEIGEMAPRTQAKLLLVLENRSITRVGGTQEIAVDVRILSATHRDLEADVAAGRFREDLYYRISTFSLKVPPLRERPTEIALLVDVFLCEFAARMEVPPPAIARDAAAALARHGWPGNVRELRNAIEHAIVMSDGATIRAEHLPDSARGLSSGAAIGGGPLRSEIANVEKKNIEAALAAENGNQTRAAQRLGISRRALIYKLAKYRIART